MSESIIAMRSETIAAKSLRLLTRHGIACRIVSVDPTLTRRGCSVGIAMNSFDVNRAEKLLEAAKINYGEILGSGGLW